MSVVKSEAGTWNIKSQVNGEFYEGWYWSVSRGVAFDGLSDDTFEWRLHPRGCSITPDMEKPSVVGSSVADGVRSHMERFNIGMWALYDNRGRAIMNGCGDSSSRPSIHEASFVTLGDVPVAVAEVIADDVVAEEIPEALVVPGGAAAAEEVPDFPPAIVEWLAPLKLTPEASAQVLHFLCIKNGATELDELSGLGDKDFEELLELVPKLKRNGFKEIFNSTVRKSSPKSLSFPIYETGALVERRGVVINCLPFEFSATVTPSRATYGMIMSCDRDCERHEQFRLEFYASGRVGLAMSDTRCQRGRLDGDPNGYRPDLCSPVLPLNVAFDVVVRRTGNLTYELLVNGSVCSNLKVDSFAPVASGNYDRAIRVGSRYRTSPGDGMTNQFEGTITNATLRIG